MAKAGAKLIGVRFAKEIIKEFSFIIFFVLPWERIFGDANMTIVNSS
jgi:hypothetical protein